jgi:hypothetical protein
MENAPPVPRAGWHHKLAPPLVTNAPRGRSQLRRAGHSAAHAPRGAFRKTAARQCVTPAHRVQCKWKRAKLPVSLARQAHIAHLVSCFLCLVLLAPYLMGPPPPVALLIVCALRAILGEEDMHLVLCVLLALISGTMEKPPALSAPRELILLLRLPII